MDDSKKSIQALQTEKLRKSIQGLKVEERIDQISKNDNLKTFPVLINILKDLETETKQALALSEEEYKNLSDLINDRIIKHLVVDVIAMEKNALKNVKDKETIKNVKLGLRDIKIGMMHVETDNVLNSFADDLSEDVKATIRNLIFILYAKSVIVQTNALQNKDIISQGWETRNYTKLDFRTPFRIMREFVKMVTLPEQNDTWHELKDWFKGIYQYTYKLELAKQQKERHQDIITKPYIPLDFVDTMFRNKAEGLTKYAMSLYNKEIAAGLEEKFAERVECSNRYKM